MYHDLIFRSTDKVLNIELYMIVIVHKGLIFHIEIFQSVDSLVVKIYRPAFAEN